jgi:hypothetical protein
MNPVFGARSYGQQNERRIWEKTGREAERETNLGKDRAGSGGVGPSWSQGVGVKAITG